MSAEPTPPLVSTRAELRNLRNNSQATVAELKAFLGELKGRSPQEMLGMVASNQLFRATIHALILIGALIAVFTVVPYLTRDEPAIVVPKTAETSPTPAPAETPAESATPTQPDTVEKLGIGEEKQAPPDVNPLDSGIDNFLDELE
jgi:cell envelope opacity-associated protein A